MLRSSCVTTEREQDRSVASAAAHWSGYCHFSEPYITQKQNGHSNYPNAQGE